MQLNITDTFQCDVAVFGGGPAGFCAAVAAARVGARTMLFEQSGMLGGNMTQGGIPAPALFHAHGKQVIAGIGWELMTALAKRGCASLPQPPFIGPHPVMGVELNAFEAAWQMDQMACEAGVQLMFHQKAVAAQSEDGCVTGVVVSGPSGLKVVHAGVYVDCTGSASIAHMAGAACELGEDLQPGSLNVTLAGFDPTALDPDVMDASYRAALADGRLLPGDVWSSLTQTFTLRKGRGRGYHGQPICELNPGSNVNHVYPLNDVDDLSRTEGELQGRNRLHRMITWLRTSVPGCENAYIAACSPAVAARESRRIVGEAYITAEDYLHSERTEDAVCYSYYPIDLHTGNEEKGLVNMYHDDQHVPRIPYGALIPRGYRNLLVAGKTISGDRLAQSAYRIQATCMATGQAAGTAAALSLGQDCRRLDVAQLRRTLHEAGAMIPGLTELA